MPKGNAIAAAVLAASGRGASAAPGNASGLSPLVASFSQSYSANVPYSPLPRPPATFLNGAFGPMDPIVPMPINQPREDTHRPDTRRFQAPVGWNLPTGTPGEGKLAPFATLRALADTYSVARSCVDKRKQEVVALDWDIVPTDEAEQALMGDESARADWEKRRAIVKEFFSHPDSDRAKFPTFGAWLDAILEDRFVIDAVAVHLVPPRKKGAGPFGSDLASLDVLDGSTIQPLLDINSSTPRAAAPAYQQYLFGVPRVDLIVPVTGQDAEELGEPVGDFRADQLIYMRETTRNQSPWGFSCVEKALLPISIGLARQQYQNLYFQDGSIPGMFVTPGPDIATPQQVRQLQDALNAMAGDIGSKHRMIVFPPGTKAEMQKPFPLADQFDEWVISQVAMPFGLTPMDLGVTPRVSAVQSPSESRELSQINSDKGSQTRIEPVCADLKAVLFDYVIQKVFGQRDMQFSWGLTDRGKNRQLLIDQGVELVKVGGKTLDELRISLGDTPYGLPESSVPLIYTATGAMPLQAAAPENALPPGQAGRPGQGAAQVPTDDELTTPAHEAVRALPKSPSARVLPGGPKPGAKPAPSDVQAADAQKQAAELEILARYLRKGRDLARFRAETLPAEALDAAARMLPQGVPAAVKAARDAVDAKRRQARRDRHLEAAAATVAARLGQLVRDHKHAGLSLPHLVDGGVAVMADGYRQAMAAGAQDASDDYEDTPAADGADIDDGARSEAEGQRGYLTGLLQDVITGLSAAAIGARLALYASTLYRAYNAAYGTTVTTAHPDYEIQWELGDSRDHCRLCVERDGKTFTVHSLPGWPGDGGFGGADAICLGGPNCRCSIRFVQSGQTVSTGTNTQLDWSGQYYDQQRQAITAARAQAAQARAEFVDSIPDGPAIRAMTRDGLRRELADLANQRIRQAGGYPGVSVEPQDIPASVIARMLPPGLEGAAGPGTPRLDVEHAIEEMFAAKGAALDMTKREFRTLMTRVFDDAVKAAARQDPPRAAFLLMRAPNENGKWRYLLQKRADETSNGGTWGLPGGKANGNESPWETAVREATEEFGNLPAVKPAAVWSRNGGTRTVYLVDLAAQFAPDSGDAETAGWGWFKRRDVENLPLHPALRDLWRCLDFHGDRLGGEKPDMAKGARGYQLNPRSGMISLDLPDGLIEPIPGGVSDFHITCVYLGPDVSDEAFAYACERAAQAAAAAPGPLAGVISGLGTFAPSVSSDGLIPVWAGVTLPGAEQIRAALNDLSASEHPDWHPHVTRCYAEAGDVPPDPLPATPVTFTHLSVHRGEQVARFPLGAQG